APDGAVRLTRWPQLVAEVGGEESVQLAVDAVAWLVKPPQRWIRRDCAASPTSQMARCPASRANRDESCRCADSSSVLSRVFAAADEACVGLAVYRRWVF